MEERKFWAFEVGRVYKDTVVDVAYLHLKVERPTN